MLKRLVRLKIYLIFACRNPRLACQWLTRVLRAKRFYPDIFSADAFKTFRNQLTSDVLEFVDDRLNKDRPLDTQLRPLSSVQIKTDVLYVGTFKADAYKDLAALRMYDSSIHITAVMLPTFFSPAKHRVFQLCDEVLFPQSMAEYVELLLSIQAKALVFQGGDDQLALLTSCLWPGRLVWQVRDVSLRAPRRYLNTLSFERARYIAERADAIISFHHTQGWKHLSELEGIPYRSQPLCIPPGCMPSLGPHFRKTKLSTTDQALHIAYAGGVGPKGGTSYGPVTHTHADFYEKFKSIVDQGIHLHVYSPHLKTSSSKHKEYFELAKQSPFFHIEQPLDFEDLLLELTQYDWGIMHVTWQPELLITGFDWPIQNGLMQHIQARIPIIVSPTALGNADLIHRTKRGVVVDEKDIPQLRHILDSNAHLMDECLTRPFEQELLYDYAAFGKAVFDD